MNFRKKGGGSVLVFYSPSLSKYFQTRPKKEKLKELAIFLLKGHFCRLF